MGTVILWGFAIVGGVGALVIGGFWLTELWAEKQQREGKNPFQ